MLMAGACPRNPSPDHLRFMFPLTRKKETSYNNNNNNIFVIIIRTPVLLVNPTDGPKQGRQILKICQ